jgi:transposase
MAWKQDAIGGLGEPCGANAADTRQDRRRIKELEHELHRKDKALAETAALLVPLPRTGLVIRPASLSDTCPFAAAD